MPDPNEFRAFLAAAHPSQFPPVGAPRVSPAEQLAEWDDQIPQATYGLVYGEPLLYTTKGNIPLRLVELRTGWHVTPDTIAFREAYYLGEACVKESVHVYKPNPGEVAQTAAGQVGG